MFLHRGNIHYSYFLPFLGVSVDDLKGGHKACDINACIKSGSLRFSRLLTDLSVNIIMGFDFPFVRLLGVR
jgi:hypothetical protein